MLYQAVGASSRIFALMDRQPAMPHYALAPEAAGLRPARCPPTRPRPAHRHASCCSLIPQRLLYLESPSSIFKRFDSVRGHEGGVDAF